MSERAFWVGTYTGEAGAGAGIYRVARRSDGTLRAPELAAGAVSPSYLAAQPGKGVIYAVREEDEGGVVAFDASGGRLREIGVRAAGALPCHLSV
ncbi:lactonase family protein, partial [Actinomadura geliboluensis]